MLANIAMVVGLQIALLPYFTAQIIVACILFPPFLNSGMMNDFRLLASVVPPYDSWAEGFRWAMLMDAKTTEITKKPSLNVTTNTTKQNDAQNLDL